MIIIFEKLTHVIKRFSTNSFSPLGEKLNIKISEDEKILRIKDDSELAIKIRNMKGKLQLTEDFKDVIELQESITQREKIEQKYKNENEYHKLKIDIPDIVENLLENNSLILGTEFEKKLNRKKQLRNKLGGD